MREIFKYGNPEHEAVLRGENKEVTDIAAALAIAEDMKEIINNPETAGLGMAAPQVGENLRMFIMREAISSSVTDMMSKGIKVIMNPVILKKSDKMKTFTEGCLSVPDHRAAKARHSQIKVRYMNENGVTVTEKFNGIDAVVFQHEYDHVEGKLCLDNAIQIFALPKAAAPDIEAAEEDAARIMSGAEAEALTAELTEGVKEAAVNSEE